MTRTHRHLPRRDLDPSQYLRHLSQVTLQNRGRNRRPYQTLGNPRIARVERMKIRIRLPLLEQQLNLPPQPIELPHLLRTEPAPRQIRHQQRMTPLITIPSRQQPQLQRLLSLPPNHIEIDRLALRQNTLLQQLPRPLPQRLPFPRIRTLHLRVDRCTRTHHEVPTRPVHRTEVLPVEVPSVRQQQVIAQCLGRGQMGPLRRRVRRQRHLLHRLIQHTHRHVQLHRSRVLLLESSRVMLTKRPEPSGITIRHRADPALRLQHAHHPLKDHVQHGPHEVLEGTKVVERLVRHRGAEQELPLHIGQCLDRPRGMACQQAQDQSSGVPGGRNRPSVRGH